MRCASRWRAARRRATTSGSSPQRVESNRNFATKLWNAARFVEFNGAGRVAGFDPKSAKETLNRWIAHETAKATREVTEAIEAYRFNEAADAAYRFVWNVYCDWYVELSKPLLTGPDGAAKDETRAMAAWALDEILKLLHPFMPFITEELWRVTAETGPKRDALLVLAPGRQHDGLDDAKAEAEIGWLIDLVTAIRSVRAEMNIAAADPAGAGAARRPRARARAERWAEFVKRLARVADISFADDAAAGLGAAAGSRRGRGAAAQGRDRPRRRARAARQGNAEGRGRHQARRRQARQSEIRRQRARGDHRRRARKARGGRAAAARRSSRRWSGCKAPNERPNERL